MKNGGIFFTSRFWLTKLDVADIGVLQNRLKNKKPRISARFFLRVDDRTRTGNIQNHNLGL